MFLFSKIDHHLNEPRKPSPVVETIENGFKTTREAMQAVTSSLSEQRAQISGYINHAKDQTSCKSNQQLYDSYN